MKPWEVGEKVYKIGSSGFGFHRSTTVVFQNTEIGAVDKKGCARLVGKDGKLEKQKWQPNGYEVGNSYSEAMILRHNDPEAARIVRATRLIRVAKRLERLGSSIREAAAVRDKTPGIEIAEIEKMLTEIERIATPADKKDEVTP